MNKDNSVVYLKLNKRLFWHDENGGCFLKPLWYFSYLECDISPFPAPCARWHWGRRWPDNNISCITGVCMAVFWYTLWQWSVVMCETEKMKLLIQNQTVPLQLVGLIEYFVLFSIVSDTWTHYMTFAYGISSWQNDLTNFSNRFSSARFTCVIHICHIYCLHFPD